MPELPEVETVCRGIAPLICGRRIDQLVIRTAGLRQPLNPALSRILPGQTIIDVTRRAKYLLLKTDRGGLLVHLGMTGVLRHLPAGSAVQKHDHIDLTLADGWCLRFTDPRRFGQFIYTPDDPADHPLVRHLGPEPLEDDFDGEQLYHRSRGRIQAVKPFLMDQRVVVGVGNIYANEALFQAGIDPARRAGRISCRRYQLLAAAVKEVLAAAIEAGGTTLNDFSSHTGQPGYFARQLQVYGRASKPCRRCGASLRVRRIGQRSTYDCPACQR